MRPKLIQYSLRLVVREPGEVDQLATRYNRFLSRWKFSEGSSSFELRRGGGERQGRSAERPGRIRVYWSGGDSDSSLKFVLDNLRRLISQDRRETSCIRLFPLSSFSFPMPVARKTMTGIEPSDATTAAVFINCANKTYIDLCRCDESGL